MMVQKLIDQHLKHIPIADKARERELIIRAQKGQEAAMLELFASNYRYIFRFLRKNGVMNRSDKEDVFQEAVVGCCEAVKRFDFSYENRFVQYLFEWVRAQVFSYLTQNHHIVKLPRGKFFFFLLAQKKILEKSGRASFVEIRDALMRESPFPNWLPQYDHILWLYLSSWRSMDYKVSGFCADGESTGAALTYQDVIPNPYSLEFNQFRIAEKKEAYLFLRRALESRTLSPVHRAVITCRFLKSMSTHETSRYLAARNLKKRVVSHQAISAIEKQALQRLRKVFRKAGVDGLE